MSFLDIHAHFPMHLDFPPRPSGDPDADRRNRRLLELATGLGNFELWSPRVTLSKAYSGQLRGFASVLYNPADEFCRPRKPFLNLINQIYQVEEEVDDDRRFRIVQSGADLKRVVDDPDSIAVFHCVEGGYAIEHPRNVEELAKHGVAYVTLAHLFHKKIANPANAFPFLNDELHQEMFGCAFEGLSTLGKDICEALFDHGILVDIVHCSPKAIDDVFAIAKGRPVIASHTASDTIRPAQLNLSDKNIRRIAESGGLIGLIFFDHWLETESLRGFDALFRHIDHITKVCGSHKHIAIGSDLDGFIKPISGLRNYRIAGPRLKRKLLREYGHQAAEAILWKNGTEFFEVSWRPQSTWDATEDAHEPIVLNLTESRRPRKVIQDWAHFIRFTPREIRKPTSLEELQQVLEEGGSTTKIRTLGSLHSCARICEAAKVLDLRGLPKEIEFQDNGDVEVTTNVTLHDLLLELSKAGKSLPATGGTDAQTIAGVLSTNTAPATPKHGIYDDFHWIDYLTYDQGGRVVERRAHRGTDEFLAAVCSLGALGVLTRARFRPVEEKFFRTTQRIVSLDSILRDIDVTSKQHEFWRVNWIPDTEDALLWAATSIPKEQAEENGDYEEDGSEGLLGALFKVWDVLSFGHAGPHLDPVMKLIYKSVVKTFKDSVVTGPLRNMLPVDRKAPLRVAMAEWVFRPDDLERTLRICSKYYENQKWPNLPIEIELAKTDGYFMSPWNWPDLGYVVKFNFMYLTDVSRTAREKKEIRAHLRGLWGALVDADVCFKAHWGKINFMDAGFVREHFEYDKFASFVHPAFVNDYLRDRFPV